MLDSEFLARVLSAMATQPRRSSIGVLSDYYGSFLHKISLGQNRVGGALIL